MGSEIVPVAAISVSLMAFRGAKVESNVEHSGPLGWPA